MPEARPLAVFYAGANGSGKSTLRDSGPLAGLVTLDPDAIAKRLNPHDPRAADLQAGRMAARQFAQLITDRQGFSMETTLSGRTVLLRMARARAAGFEVHLYYVGLCDVEHNIARVAMRVARGGHFIAEADIRRRYTESHENLPRAMALADSGKLFSNDGHKHVIQYEFVHGVLTPKVSDPALWAQRAVKRQTRHVQPP